VRAVNSVFSSLCTIIGALSVIYFYCQHNVRQQCSSSCAAVLYIFGYTLAHICMFKHAGPAVQEPHVAVAATLQWVICCPTGMPHCLLWSVLACACVR
jgi:hypothetical protein